MNMFRKKPLTDTSKTESVSQLKKSLGPFDVVALGVGAIVGTGIFVLTGVIAAKDAGPGILVSFILAGIACFFAALCYSELAAAVPVAGSAYAYSYSSFGELIAWILGWDLILEYGLACAAVASGWSGYFQGLINGFGLHLPVSLTSAYNPSKGTYFDLPAVLIMLLITFLLTRGAKESARLNAVMVVIKVAVVLLFIVVGAFYVKPANWSPFAPFGFSGIELGGATVFFAYIGFDAVSTSAEEVRNPQRNMPIGILGSLLICTILYIAVSLVLTGMVPYHLLDVKNPVSFALQFVHLNWVAGFVSLAALIGITTVLLVMSYGQTRLIYSMSRDGLLPTRLSAVSKRQVPQLACWTTGIVVSVFAGVVPLDKLAQLVNIGTLFAFAMVSIGVIVLRKTQPQLARPFKVPLMPWLPIVSTLCCGYLLFELPRTTWVSFSIWLVLGLVFYFAYGYRHSALGRSQAVEDGSLRQISG